MTIKDIYCKSLWFQLFLASVMGILVYNASIYAENEEEWMPDPGLREAVREKLSIPADSPLILAYVQLHLTSLNAINKGIVDLTGLEHATDLQFLVLPKNNIQDTSPLSGITGLVFLDLSGNQIVDLSPLAGLENLEVLGLSGNQIVDVSPLAGLVNLRYLSLGANQIVDLSPLAGLENLEDLRIRGNADNAIFTLPLSKLMQFGYHETCDLAGIPISERIENRDYPSICAPIGGAGTIINLPELPLLEGWAYHDLHWNSLLFGMRWHPTPEGLRTLVHVEDAKQQRNQILSLNPNMISMAAMNYFGANPGEYPEDWPYWLRDESGDIIEDVGWGGLLVDFTHPEIQDLLVRRAVEFAKCGLFDGISLDWWRDDWRDSGLDQYYAYDVSESAITMLRRIREGVDEVRDDFLIIANGNRTKLPLSAPYLNGTHMETTYGYSYTGLVEIESTLLWSEQNFREPQINCLEGWADNREPPDSPRNQQWMRLFTTMSLTHSDGYVRFWRGISSEIHRHFYEISEGHSEVHARGERHSHGGHYWYPFYDAPLGRPVGDDETKGQLYENREGLFIREFTNGWAVYNRSGTEQTIEFSEAVSGVASGVEEKRSHTLPDLDGEIYLKSESGLETPPTADINGDGVVNIQDLVIVANALGKAEPDLNGDGVVNIQDLVLVANAF